MAVFTRADKFDDLPIPVRPRPVSRVAYDEFLNPFTPERRAKWEASRIWCLPEGIHSEMSILWPDSDPTDWICVPPNSFEEE